jgi:hypothetical protein
MFTSSTMALLRWDGVLECLFSSDSITTTVGVKHVELDSCVEQQTVVCSLTMMLIAAIISPFVRRYTGYSINVGPGYLV